MENSSTFCLLDISDWWRQQEETHSKYADISNEVRDTVPIIPHGVGVEASFSLAEMLLAGGCQKPHAKPFAKKSLSGSSLEPIMGFLQALTQNWILQTQRTTRK